MALHPSPETVLVADDTESVRSLFNQLLLAAGGHGVITAEDGSAALEAVQRHRLDVLLLDVRMPGADGIEVCTRRSSALGEGAAIQRAPAALVTP